MNDMTFAGKPRTLGYFQMTDLAQRILTSATLLQQVPHSPSNLWVLNKANEDIRFYAKKLLEGLGDE